MPHSATLLLAPHGTRGALNITGTSSERRRSRIRTVAWNGLVCWSCRCLDIELSCASPLFAQFPMSLVWPFPIVFNDEALPGPRAASFPSYKAQVLGPNRPSSLHFLDASRHVAQPALGVRAVTLLIRRAPPRVAGAGDVITRKTGKTCRN